MNNIFIVYTPLQLYIAQEIIVQERLKNNILVYSYSLNSKDFPILFEFIINSFLWKKCIEINDINNLFYVNLRKPISSSVKTYKIFHKFLKIFDAYQISNIFVGEVNNTSIRILSNIFSARKIIINLFEEGSSHYNIRHCPSALCHRPILGIVYSFLFDTFFYKPFLNVAIGDLVFLRGTDFTDMSVNTRFSILDCFHEVFDKKLICRNTVSIKINNLINKEIKGIDIDNSVLFLSQPIYDVVNDNKGIYIETIRNYIYADGNNRSQYIVKFHPRESDAVKSQITDLLTSLNVKYIVIGKDINLPIEFYLQKLHFKKVVHFFSSTCLYNGLLFQTTTFVSLMVRYYNMCKENDVQYAHQIESTINSKVYQSTSVIF